ncbi:MAG TPA: hypothetical protein VM617_04375, partial [Thermoanaerobaculia bacterium]|nr:hypothetical protein [Thermoanaerobaculia bacterium]
APRAADWFRESAVRYAAKHHPSGRRAVLAAVARLGAGGRSPAAASAGNGTTEPAADELALLDLSPFHGAGRLWIEVSPRAEGFPAAAEPLAPGTSAWSLPHEIAAGLSGTWWAQVTDDAGRELLRCRLAVGDEG